MCGIVGYIGRVGIGDNGERDAVGVVLRGLERLEYRGYDSAGVSFFVNGGPLVVRTVGKVENLTDELERIGAKAEVPIAIGHTRWATHGIPAVENAHPHVDCTGSVSVVHNGIIENHSELREELISQGHVFLSTTDTEVLPHLIERELAAGVSFEEAVRLALTRVRGSYALAALSSKHPERIVAARKGSPLLIGIAPGEFLLASDASAVVELSRDVVYLDDGEYAVIGSGGFAVHKIDGGSFVEKDYQTIDWTVEESQRGGFEHFMLKEIHESPKVMENCLRGRVSDEGMARLPELDRVSDALVSAKRVVITGCGTSYYAALVGKYLLEKIAGMPVEVSFASEFRYHPPVLGTDTLVIAVTQSGETADTLEAVREAKRQGSAVVCVVNVVGSTISREADVPVYTYAGPEIAVASTKAFVSQLAALALISAKIGELKGVPRDSVARIVRELEAMPEKAERVLEGATRLRWMAERYHSYENFMFIGRQYNWATALEGALKLKEISYIHAEGLPAGELKHGPLALIEPNVPTVAIALRDEVYDKVISNIEEVRTRKGKVIAIATEGDDEILAHVDHAFFVPETIPELGPLIAVIPLQLFAYYCAVLRGTDVDRPRNLAKSVTVE